MTTEVIQNTSPQDSANTKTEIRDFLREHRMSVGKKIILHLYKNLDLRMGNEYASVFSKCQDGIARPIGISRAHVSVEVKKLMQDELVSCELKHIKESKIRRASYELSPKGVEYAKALLKEHFRDEKEFREYCLGLQKEVVRGPADKDLSAANELLHEAVRKMSHESGFNPSITDVVSALEQVNNASRYLARFLIDRVR